MPAYAANGQRLRNYSLEAVERFLALDPPACAVKRNRKTGRITSVQFLPLAANSATVQDNKHRLRKSASLGQRYSFQQPLDDSGMRAWRFKGFLIPRDMSLDPGVSASDIEEWLKRVFRSVALSCLTTVPESIEASSPGADRPEPDPPAMISSRVRPRRPAPPYPDDVRLAA